jgi:magnesium-transporting ATPase (P-type)
VCFKNPETENLIRIPLVEVDPQDAELTLDAMEEAALTGESVAARKKADALPAGTMLGDRVNQAFAGTLVTCGQAEGAMLFGGRHVETELEQIF